MDITPKPPEVPLIIGRVGHQTRDGRGTVCGLSISSATVSFSGIADSFCPGCFPNTAPRAISTLDLPMTAAPPLYGTLSPRGKTSPPCLTAATSEEFDRPRFTFCGLKIYPGTIAALGRHVPLCEKCAIVAVEIAAIARGPALPAGWRPS